ncbi:MAG: amidohydrolase family protein [bacterium]|nr:amidohydrolase family protein [bacterium]
MYLLKNVFILNPAEDRTAKFDFYNGHILVRDGVIRKIYKSNESIDSKETINAEIIDGESRKLVFPGFIQSHIHLCQTQHRNLAEQMPLIQWLKQEIWPYEGNLTAKTMGQTVMMSLKEILSSGTTAVLDMGTIRHQEVIFEIMEKAGFRYTGGKAMMDACDGAPENLTESIDDSIRQSMELYERYHGKNNGLLQYAFAPRFVLSCSTDLLHEVRKLSDTHGILIHSHASEHPEEVAFIKESTGYGNIAYLDHIEALNRHSVFAHMVHLDEDEKEMVKKYRLTIAHCPTTNLKLGSGIAPIPEYLDKGFLVGIGCDGAPCNNSLSIFNELKLAPLLQKGLHNDPIMMPSEDALRLISTNGARVIRQQEKVGRIEENMEADLVMLDMDTPQTYNFEKAPAAALVYGADARNVYATMVKGKFLYRDGNFSKEINEIDEFYED